MSVDGSRAVELEFPYTYFKNFAVLGWIGEDKILVEQTDRDENDLLKEIRTYWIAPVTDLSQKKIVSF